MRRGRAHRFLGWLIVVAGVAGCRPSNDDAVRPLRVVGELGTTPGNFRQPRAITVDRRDGSFFVVDRSGRIQRFAADGALLAVFALPESDLGQPVGVALEPGRNGRPAALLVNDSHYQRLLRYSLDGAMLLASWGSRGTGPGQFTFGRDVVVDGDGNIYAGDYGGLNDRIMKFSPAGEFLLEWGRHGDGPGEFNRPQGMSIERRQGEEFVLVADCSNHRVQRFRRDGTFVSSWGSLGTAPGQLRHPSSVAVDDEGWIYVSEWGNNRVQRFDASGRSDGVWGGPGRAEGELATPWDVDVGPDGTVYVVDYGNHRVQIFRWPHADAANGETANVSAGEQS